MLCFKIFLRTCALALIMLCYLPGQAQDEICHLTLFRIEPGQELAIIRANAVYTENGRTHTDQPRTTYVYSDHTIGIAVPADDLPHAERQEARRYFTNNFITTSELIDNEIEMCDPRVYTGPITGREERVRRYRANLSYIPSPTARPGGQAEPVPYYEVTTYRAKPGQLDKVLEISRRLTGLMKEMDSPVAFNCYTYEFDGEPDAFDIAFPAEDPDDLAERRAFHNANLSEAAKLLLIEMSLYVDEVRTVTGRYVAEMSTSGSLHVNAKR